jgi:hypothetical protein
MAASMGLLGAILGSLGGGTPLVSIGLFGIGAEEVGLGVGVIMGLYLALKQLL